MRLWAEIRQRRITQIFFTYLAGGWMVLAVFDQLVDREILPLVFYEVVLTLYVFGMAFALVVGWYHGEKGAQEATRFELGMLAIITLAGLGASAGVVRSSMRADAMAEAVGDAGYELRRVAVLYFDDMSSDGSLTPVADGITEGLIRALSQVRELDVTSRNGSERVRGLALDSVAGILGAGTLIHGTVDQIGDQLRVAVRILEGGSGIALSREQYTWPADGIVAVGDELASEVAIQLRERLGEEIRLRSSRSSAPSSAAWLRTARAERSLKEAQAAVRRGDGGAVADAFDAAVAELDALIPLAEQESWAEPLVLRGLVSYESYVLAGSIEELLGTLREASEYADRALDLEPNSAAALELRGTADYRRWLVQAEDDDVLDRLFASAKKDLTDALLLERGRASANSTLSHLYYQEGDWANAVLAAREAYTEDAFLAAADGVLWRLYSGSYDLDDFDEAERWCTEGRRRFPDNYRFIQCQIFLMTMDQAEPDIDLAWELLAEFEELAPPGQNLEALCRLAVGAVIGRANLPDSADAVFVGARVGPGDDPEGELQAIEAAMRSVIGDADGSIEVLTRFMSAHPDHFPGQHWWWHSVEGRPEFERLRNAS